MSGKGWPALAGGLHNLTTYQTGRERRAEGRAEVRPSLLLVGGEVVEMTSPRRGRGVRPSLSLSDDTSGRWGERLAMVWTVEAADGTEERRGTGEDGGGILRPGSLSFFVCSFALPYPHHLKEGRGRGRGGHDGRP